MIHLVYADRAARLVEAMAERIAHQRATGHPLDPVTIVVPHPTATAYLKIALARYLGIAANFRFEFLRSFLADLIETSHPEVRVVDRSVLEILLLDILQNLNRLDQTQIGPVTRYLDAVPDESTRDLRRVQLAQALASLLDAYMLSRHTLLRKWLTPAPTKDSVEQWQRALWRALVLDGPLAEGAALVSLDQAFERHPFSHLSVPPNVHIFDATVGGTVLQHILSQLGREAELHLYALNPCLEFWEDVRPEWRSEALRARLRPRAEPITHPAGEPTTDDTPLLRLWGRPGRENIRLLNELTDCDFEARFSDPNTPAPRLLDRIRRDVLVRAPERVQAEPQPTDGSLRVVACASLHREVEMIAEVIWSLIESDEPTAESPPLRFSDIAIALSGRDRDAYRAHISAVFQERFGIPYGYLEAPLSASSRVVEAFQLLLSLPFSSFTRQELLRLVTHPVILARYEEVDPDTWLSWCEELTIVHGSDHGDHADTYIERDLYNWDQGLKRLTLGQLMASERTGDHRTFPLDGQQYLPHDRAAKDTIGASRLITLVRSLIRDARFVRTRKMELSEWTSYLRTLVSTYLTAHNELDERDLFRILTTLESMHRLEVTQTPLSFREVSSLVAARLADLTAHEGQPLAEGVVVAPLDLIAALPFRAVFVPGLAEGYFPASEHRDRLDLRQIERRPGDVSFRERDQYAFLSRLLATEETLVLSYVSRNPQTGDRLAPSPVLQEILHTVERSYLGPDGRERIFEERPLRRYDPTEPNTDLLPAAARREAQVLALRNDLEAHLGPDSTFPRLDHLRQTLSEPAWQRLTHQLRLAEPPAARHTLAERIFVPYIALRRFLEDPLQGWAEMVLGLEDDDIEADPYDREDELFRAGPLEQSRLLTSVFLDYLDNLTDLAALYRTRAELRELGGHLPTGMFADAEHRRHLRILEAWVKQLKRVFQGRLVPLQRVRFGSTRGTGTDIVPPWQVELTEGRTVELRGQTDPLTEAPRGSFIPLVKKPRSEEVVAEELRGFLDHAILSVIGRPTSGPYHTFIAYEEDNLRRLSFEPLSPAEAEAYLTQRLHEMLFENHDYHLPFSTVARIQRAKDRGRAAIEDVLSKVRPPRFGPLSHPEARALDPDEAVEIIERRFGPFFERRRGGQG